MMSDQNKDAISRMLGTMINGPFILLLPEWVNETKRVADILVLSNLIDPKMVRGLMAEAADLANAATEPRLITPSDFQQKPEEN